MRPKDKEKYPSGVFFIHKWHVWNSTNTTSLASAIGFKGCCLYLYATQFNIMDSIYRGPGGPNHGGC